MQSTKHMPKGQFARFAWIAAFRSISKVEQLPYYQYERIMRISRDLTNRFGVDRVLLTGDYVDGTWIDEQNDLWLGKLKQRVIGCRFSRYEFIIPGVNELLSIRMGQWNAPVRIYSQNFFKRRTVVITIANA